MIEVGITLSKGALATSSFISVPRVISVSEPIKLERGVLEILKCLELFSVFNIRFVLDSVSNTVSFLATCK